MTTETLPPVATPEEIAKRYEERTPRDMFGFETGEYLPYMTFATAKPFLKDTVTEEEFNKFARPLTREGILAQMQTYMPFAWEKANNFRGISANRSIQHYVAWTWLIGDRELSEYLDADGNYECYGKDLLVKVCEKYGWDAKQWDDGVRKNSEIE